MCLVPLSLRSTPDCKVKQMPPKSSSTHGISRLLGPHQHLELAYLQAKNSSCSLDWAQCKVKAGPTRNPTNFHWTKTSPSLRSPTPGRFYVSRAYPVSLHWSSLGKTSGLLELSRGSVQNLPPTITVPRPATQSPEA